MSDPLVERTADDVQYVRAIMAGIEGVFATASGVAGQLQSHLVIEALLSTLSAVAKGASRGDVSSEHDVYRAAIDYFRRALDGTLLSYSDQQDGGTVS